MNEVAAQTGALLLDALDQRGLDPAVVWQGLPVTRELLRERGARLDWETWVAMCARAELHSPVPMDELFVAGAGARSGHPFAQIAGSLLSVRDLYAFFARWGIRRSFTNARGAFVMETPTRARFTMTIDAQHAGSTPSMKFLAGMLRLMTWMQGYPPTQVDATIDTTGHHAEYVIELPTERSFVARTRRVLRVFGGVNATLAELEAQANEIATKNAALEVQLAGAGTRRRDAFASRRFSRRGSTSPVRSRSIRPSGDRTFIPRIALPSSCCTSRSRSSVSSKRSNVPPVRKRALRYGTRTSLPLT